MLDDEEVMWEVFGKDSVEKMLGERRICARAAGTVQTRYHVYRKGQLKEQAGFLVSKSDTRFLPEREVLVDDFPVATVSL